MWRVLRRLRSYLTAIQITEAGYNGVNFFAERVPFHFHDFRCTVFSGVE